MSDVNGLRFFEVAFEADGSLAGEIAPGDGGLPAAIAAGGIDDLFVFAHGWNASQSSARAMHRDMFAGLSELLGDRRGTCAAVGVGWPSLLFPEDDPSNAAPSPSGGVQLANALAPAFPQQQYQLDELGALLDRQPPDVAELQRFHSLAKSLVTSPSQTLEDSGEAGAFSADTLGLFGNAAVMTRPPVVVSPTSTHPFAVLWSGGREVLRTLSYYEMKNRAGIVGMKGLGPLLGRLRGPSGAPRIHLMGHSFGARLVSYALAGLTPNPNGGVGPVKSLYLVQGAFSHFAFADPMPIDAERSGALAAFADRVDGPLVATFSSHDRCLGWWYPTVSMVNHSRSGAADELAYEWGAMGHDGYQGPGTRTASLGPVGQDYGFQTGVQYLLDASDVISANQSTFSGAHSDIRHPEVLWAFAAAAGF